MALAEARTMDNGEGPKRPEWLNEGISWGPRKWNELRSFFSEVWA